MSKETIELTILMPCLNESKTIKNCIEKAKIALEANNIVGEILVADNGSKDNSKEIALESGARVIDIDNKGYGNALIEGIKQAKRKVYNYGR